MKSIPDRQGEHLSKKLRGKFAVRLKILWMFCVGLLYSPIHPIWNGEVLSRCGIPRRTHSSPLSEEKMNFS